MKKVIAVILSLLGMTAIAAAADLPLKARPKPVAEPTWWISGGALIWAVKSSPLPPTLTTVVPGSPSALSANSGALGLAGTTVLSPDHLNADAFGGGRLTLGHWLADPRVGVELDGFFLVSGGAGFSRTSDGSLPLRIPFTNVPPGAGFPIGPSSFFLADPGFATGGQAISSSLKLWGIEADGLYRGVTMGPLNITLIAGLRYIDLREGLSIVSTENLLRPTASFTGTDSFATRNQFFGAQIGAKAGQQFGRFDVSEVAKVALGDNYQTVSIAGSSIASGFGTPPFSPGGVFTQVTNIGQQTRNQFAVVPELQVQVGYRLETGVRLFAGYDFLYMSSVVRPGNQIDTTLNFTSNPTIAGTGSTLTGAARPAPLLNGSSFWAQGLKLGASYIF